MIEPYSEKAHAEKITRLKLSIKINNEMLAIVKRENLTDWRAEYENSLIDETSIIKKQIEFIHKDLINTT